MTTKKQSTFVKSVINILLSVPTLFNLLSNVGSLIELETRLAGRGLLKMIILLLVMLSLLLSTWLSLLVLICFYLVSLKLSWVLSLFIVFILNVLLMIIITLLILRQKNNLSFPATRRLIKSVTKIN